MMATKSPASKNEATTTPGPERAETITTAVHLPKTTWTLLRAVAFHRAQLDGGRASVSKIVTQLAEDNRVAFEREIKSKR